MLQWLIYSLSILNPLHTASIYNSIYTVICLLSTTTTLERLIRECFYRVNRVENKELEHYNFSLTRVIITLFLFNIR